MTELHNIEISRTFKVAEIEFVKFKEKDGKVFAVSKEPVFSSKFGDNSNLAESTVLERLEKEFLPKIMDAIGTENVHEFETDLTALDGTKPYKNMRSLISLPTLDFYREHREIFATHNPEKYCWLATPYSEYWEDIVLCVSPFGNIVNDYSYCNYGGVRPILLFSSSISVSRDN